jgi:hypothetical protein
MLALLLALGVAVSPAQYRTARIVAGEAMICETRAQVAIAYMLADGRAPERYWTGDAEPDASVIDVVLTFRETEDPCPLATHLFSNEDLRLPAVQDIVRRSRLVAHFECAGGLALNAYAPIDSDRGSW